MTHPSLHAGPVSARVVYRALRRWLVADRELHGNGPIVRIEWPAGPVDEAVSDALHEVDLFSKTLDNGPGFLELRLRLWTGRASPRRRMWHDAHVRWSGPIRGGWHRDCGDRTYGLDHAARIAALLRAAGRAGVRMVVRPWMWR